MMPKPDASQSDDSSGRDAALSADAAPPFRIPIVSSVPFKSHPGFPDCMHPGVETWCEDGWCRIPAGCFIWGSPEGEPGRIETREQQGPVTLSHDFEIKQHEVTVEEWTTLGFPLRFDAPPTPACADASCPIEWISWSHALAFANAMSAAHNPPLAPCYELESCLMVRGNYTCGCYWINDTERECPGHVEMTAESVYECEGYRLPTRAEWQYAARAGTMNAFYSGDIAVTREQEGQATSSTATECDPVLRDPALEPVAWYCANSGGKAHHVGGKLPNSWGLYDMLGNVSEMLHDVDHARSPEFPAVDPFAEIGALQEGRPVVGGGARSWPSLLRIASGLQTGPDTGTALQGFRLARTLGKGTLPTLDDVPASNRADASNPTD